MKIFLCCFFINIIILFFAHISHAQKSARIIGGNTTTIDQQPWQVYIISQKTNQNSKCGGIIIGPTTVLTAAHCIYAYTSSQIQVYAGSTYLSQLSSGQIRNASQTLIHPGYDDNTLQDDIAIIELSTQFNFNSDVQPIRYDGGATITSPNTIATASGWGKTCASCGQPDQLQRVDMTIVDLATLNSNDYSLPLTNDKVAAGTSTVGVCSGDSGGPLWITVSGQSYVVGICSFVATAGCGTNASIFTRISSYCQWILEYLSNKANITGSGTVCTSTTYSVNNQPPNTNVTWSSANTNALSFGSNGVATRQNNNNDIVTITATFSNNYCSASINRNVTVGPPMVSSILINNQSQSPATICVNNFASIDVVPFDGNSSYSWSLSDPSNGYLTNYSSANTAFNAYTSTCFDINLVASNSCGTTQRGVTICAQNCFARYTVYPNPASDNIKIEFDNLDDAKALPDEIALLTDYSVKPLKIVDVQEVYNNKAFKSGNQIVINVKDLLRGTYYLRFKNSRREDKPVDTIRILVQ